MSDVIQGFLGIIAFLAFLAFGLTQAYAAWLGIDYHLGAFWAGAAIVVAIFFRFPLLIVVGAFLGAKDVWHWHWALAALFAAPGLALVIPAVLTGVLTVIGQAFSRRT
jgi:hypothetical protein